MRALYFDGTLLEQRELPTPKPKPKKALVRVLLAVICKTDLEITLGYKNFRRRFSTITEWWAGSLYGQI